MSIKKFLLFFIGLAITWLPLIYFFQKIDVLRELSFSIPILTLLLLFVVVVLNKTYDLLYPSPSTLSVTRIKTFFRSKIFWLAFLNLLFVISDGLFSVVIEASVQEEILALDWSNIGKALVSIAIIALRKTDILKILVSKA